MSVIVLLIVAGGAVAAGFLGAFVWAVRSGQFDDTCTPAVRMLLDDGRTAQAEPRQGPHHRRLMPNMSGPRAAAASRDHEG